MSMDDIAALHSILDVPRSGDASRILMVRQAVDEHTCRKLCAHAATSSRTPTPLMNVDDHRAAQVRTYIDIQVRQSHNIALGGIARLMLRDLFHTLVTAHIEPFFQLEIEWWEYPQLLLYPPGGRYHTHADADCWVPEKQVWERTYDRDISLLLYLNDEFTGGELYFPDLNVTITPEPGLLVAFPSSAAYRHGAQPTAGGEKMVVVSWAAAKGTARVARERPDVIRKDTTSSR